MPRQEGEGLVLVLAHEHRLRRVGELDRELQQRLGRATGAEHHGDRLRVRVPLLGVAPGPAHHRSLVRLSGGGNHCVKS